MPCIKDKSRRAKAMDYYTFRREFDFASLFPESIAELKASRHYRKMSLDERNHLYDALYGPHRRYFLSGFVSDDEKSQIIIDRGLEIMEQSLQQ
jgi:hypothetical protein